MRKVTQEEKDFAHAFFSSLGISASGEQMERATAGLEAEKYVNGRLADIASAAGEGDTAIKQEDILDWSLGLLTESLVDKTPRTLARIVALVSAAVALGVKVYAVERGEEEEEAQAVAYEAYESFMETPKFAASMKDVRRVFDTPLAPARDENDDSIKPNVVESAPVSPFPTINPFNELGGVRLGAA